jgi:CheY-like chemotaxis protein
MNSLERSLQQTDHLNPKIPVIIYTGRDMTSEENDLLQQYARTVVIKGAESQDRLVDEVSLFLHSVTSALPPEQQKIIRMIHDKDEVLRGKKILLVDDDMRNVFALSGLMGKIGMQVIMAANGEQALEKLQTDNDVDLVLMDIMMPVMDGYETMRRIRAQAGFRKLPIIALTAKAMPEDRVLCMDAGASDYITKPVDRDKLFSLMRVWLFK